MEYTDKKTSKITSPQVNIGCVVMASGEGKRFGCNKLMADFNGNPLISHAISTVLSFFDRTVVVTRHQEVAQFCQDNGVKVIVHNLPGRNDTVRLGLEQISESCEGCIFCQGDQPLLSAETINKMIDTFKSNPDKIIRLQFDSHPSSPVIFPRWAFGLLLNLPHGKGGNVVVKDNLDKVIYVTAGSVYETMDVDTKEDLENLIKHIKNEQ